MKRYAVLFTVFLLGVIIGGPVEAKEAHDDFLGVPVPEGEVLKRTKKRLELRSPWTHDEVLEYYKKEFQGMEDLKLRDWKTQSYFEDNSNRPWHSVTIDKEFEEGTKVVIVKDNWTWIIGTLILRYIGVFIVLLMLMIGMLISGAIISRSVQKTKEKE